MRLEQLEYFVSVANTLSITKASALLYTSPQNISKAIKQLEQELNVRLFNRVKNGMFLTEKGLEAYEYAERIVSQVNQLETVFKGSPVSVSTETGYSFHVLSSPLVYDILFTIINNIKFKGIIFSKIQISRKDILEINLLLEKKHTEYTDSFDCILTSFDHEDINFWQQTLQKEYVSYLMWQDRVCLEVKAEADMAEYPVIPMDILKNLPLVMYTSDAQQKTFTELVFSKRNIELNVPYRCPTETGKQFARLNKAYSIIGSQTSMFRPKPGITLIPIEGNIYTDLCLLIPRKKLRTVPVIEILSSFNELFELQKLF